MRTKRNRVEHARSNARENESWEYRTIYAWCFSVFYLTAAVGRIFKWKWYDFPIQERSKKSLSDEAHEVADTIVPYVFMG